MKKKLIILCLLVCILALTLVACNNNASDSLVRNGDFELFEEEKTQDWSVYKQKDSKATLNVKSVNVPAGSDQAGDTRGRRYIEISATGSTGVVYMQQAVKMKRGGLYKLTVEMNIATAITGPTDNTEYFGAYVGFEEAPTFQALVVRKATSGWQKQEVYFECKTGQELTLVLGIGSEHFGGGKGTVMFDNINIEKVDAIPAGATLHTVQPGMKLGEATVSGIVYTLVFLIVGAIIVYGLYYCVRSQMKKETVSIEANKKKNFFSSPLAYFLYFALGLFIIRFILFVVFGGMADYLEELGKIALQISEEGMSKLYEVSSTTLPSGMLYILTIIGSVASLVGLEAGSIGMSMLLRIPGILADLVIFYLLFNLFSKKYSGKISALFAGIFAILPLMFTVTATWGMMISIPIAFLVGMIGCMINKKYIGVSILFTLALIFNNMVLVLLPLVVMYFVFAIIKDRKSAIAISIASVICLIAFFCVSLPYTWNYLSKDFFFVFKKMLADFNSNVKITNDVFNFYAIFGQGSKIVGTGTKVITGLLFAAFIGCGVWLYSKNKNRLDLILLASLSFILVSVFGVGAQLECMVMGLILLFLYACLRGERRFFHTFAGMSTLLFVNIAAVIGNSGYLYAKPNSNAGYATFYNVDALFIIGSILAVALTVYLCKITFDIMFYEKEYEIEPLNGSVLDEWKGNFAKIKKAITKK